MASSANWLLILAALAAPTALAATYARQLRKDSDVITRELSRVQQRSPKYIERSPLRWYHVIVIVSLIALPFVQWFAYLEYRTRLSFLSPLAVAAGLMWAVGALRPRFVAAEPPDHRETGLRAAIVAAALMVALALPSSGTITVLRGALSDILALYGASYFARVWNSKSEVGISR